MKPMHLAVIGAVLAVIAVFFLMQDSGEGRRRQHGDTENSRTERAPVTGAGETDADAKASAAMGTLGVTLKVLGPDGQPALGAEITLAGRRTRGASTDEHGAAGFDGLAPGFYDLTARKGNAVAARSFELNQTRDLGTLRLAESVAISGVVYDPQGAPIPGARVEAVVSQANQSFDFSRLIALWVRPDSVAAAQRTGPQGAYELRVAKGKTFALRVIASGFAQEGEPARTYHADTSGQNFYLYRGTTVAGVVVDPEGAPIAGARVMVSDPMALFGRRMAKMESATAADGTFSMWVTPTRQTMLTARAAGYALHMDRLKLPATGLRITLEPGVQLRLRAVDARNPVPAPGVTAIINYKGGFATGKTDAAGELVIEHLPTKAGTRYGRQRQVFLMGGGYVPKELSLAKQEPVDGLLDVGEVKLERGGTITGRVLDTKTGEPVPGAAVRAFGGLDMQLQFLGSLPAVSNEKGEFQLTGVALGASMLYASHKDYVTDFNPMMFSMAGSGKALFEKGATEIEKDVEVTPAAVVEGQVVDPEGQPVAGATVGVQMGQQQMMMRIIGGGVADGVSDAGGKFLMRGLKPGQPVKLVAKHREYGSSSAVSVKPGSGEPVVLKLSEPIGLHGVVVDEQGEFVEGVRITVSRKGSPNRSGMRGPMRDQGTTRPAVTDAKGEFLVRDAPEGELLVRFDHEGYRPKERPVSVQPGAAVHEVDKTTLQRGPGIEGVVQNENGEPVAGVVVNANTVFTPNARPAAQGEGRQWANAVSDEKGRFALHGLRDGKYTVQPYQQGSYGEQKTVASGTKDLRLRLQPAAEVSGRVMAGGQPVAGANVRVENPAPATGPTQRGLGYARTDGEGAFTITPLPPDGRFTLVIEHDAYATRRVQGVTPGGAVRDFVLDHGVQIGGIVVDDEGNPVPNARISVIVGTAGSSKTVTADAKGNFTAGGLADGEITIHVPAWSGFIKQDPIPVAPGDMRIRVMVERGESITGSITGGSEDGGLRVEAIDEAGEAASTAWAWQGQRGFQLQGLRHGVYTVRVSRFVDGQWQMLAEVEGVASGREDVEVALK